MKENYSSCQLDDIEGWRLCNGNIVPSHAQ